MVETRPILSTSALTSGRSRSSIRRFSSSSTAGVFTSAVPVSDRSNKPRSRVSVLPSGHIEINDIGEVFHSPRVAGLLRQLRECFDTVIIDTPPMLQFSESRLAASLADGVLLVLRSGHTDKDSAVAAREQLVHDRIELLGTILNDWDPKQSGSSSKYGSYYASYMRYHLNKGA